MVQIHKEFTDNQVKELIERYLKREIKIHYVLEILGIKRSRFFVLLKQYKECPDTFSIQYGRNTKTRKISESIEHNIIKELKIEKDMIQDKDIPMLLKCSIFEMLPQLIEKLQFFCGHRGIFIALHIPPSHVGL